MDWVAAERGEPAEGRNIDPLRYDLAKAALAGIASMEIKGHEIEQAGRDAVRLADATLAALNERNRDEQHT